MLKDGHFLIIYFIIYAFMNNYFSFYYVCWFILLYVKNGSICAFLILKYMTKYMCIYIYIFYVTKSSGSEMQLFQKLFKRMFWKWVSVLQDRRRTDHCITVIKIKLNFMKVSEIQKTKLKYCQKDTILDKTPYVGDHWNGITQHICLT